MRSLRFSVSNTEHKRLFQTLYFGFVQGGVNLSKDKDKKPRSEVRLEARILEKLDAISEENPSLPVPWTLIKDGVISLTPEEYERIDKHLDNVNWPTGSAKDAAKLFDFWAAAEKSEKIAEPG